LQDEAHSCEKEFKTRAQCESDAAKYMQDWYVDADKIGDVVVLAPTAECWEITQLKAQHRAEAAIAKNSWMLKVLHVKYMTPEFMIDKNAVSPIPFWGIGVFVDKSENVREVEGKVPAQLDSVRVVVGEAPVVVWCLSVVEGTNLAKECSECLSVKSVKEVAKDCSKYCAVTLENEAHSCEQEFKTKAQCELGAAKYVQDWNVDADKSGDAVALAPRAECWENRDLTNSHSDPTTEKAGPDDR
jgi:hypothetical protein